MTVLVLSGLVTHLVLPPIGYAQAPVTIDGTLQGLGEGVGGSAAQELPGANPIVTEAMGAKFGPNLLHSFGRFNVPAGGSVTFTATSGGIANVVGRVTGITVGGSPGGGVSMIQGALRSTIPGANLFLANTNGFIFGAGSSLDIGTTTNRGSAFFSTADLFNFADGSVFYSDSSLDGAANSILQVASPADFGFLPASLGFTSATPASITVNPHNVALAVADGEDFGLIGGDITVSGRTVQALGGTISLVSVAGPGQVDLGTGEPTAGTPLGDITLQAGSVPLPFPPFSSTAKAKLDVSGKQASAGVPILGIPATPEVPAGTVFIRGGTLVVDNSELLADTKGDLPGLPGGLGIDVHVSNQVTLDNSALVRANTGNFSPLGGTGQGAGGGILFRTATLVMDHSSEVSTTTSGKGPAGAVTAQVNTLDLKGGSSMSSNVSAFASGSAGVVTVEGLASPAITVSISGRTLFGTRSALLGTTSGPGNAGSIIVNAETLRVDGAQIVTRTLGAGLGGNIELDVGTLTGVNGGTIITETGTSTAAGDITVQGTGGGGSFATSFELSGVDASGTRSGIRSRTVGGGTGPTGAISVKAGAGSITGGARIGGDAISAASQSKPVTVTVNGTLDVTGADPTGVPSAILSFSTSGAASGDLEVTAGTLNLDGGLIQSQSTGDGQGGNLKVTGTNQINISAQGQIASIAANKDVGDVIISTPSLTINNGSITTSTDSTGDAGDIGITATGLVNLSGLSEITSSSEGSTGNAGKIQITSPAVFVNNAKILTQSDSTGAGGSINVAASGSMTLTNATISASVADLPPGGDPATGDIKLTGGSVSVSNSTIGAESSGTRNAGSVSVQASQNLQATGSTVSTAATSAAAAAKGGDILIAAGNQVGLVNTTVSTNTLGTGNAGAITASAGTSLSLTGNSALQTTATQAEEGGSITILVNDTFRQTNSLITSSIGSQTLTSKGGDIFIDPIYVILQNGQILANAFNGTGGNITIVASGAFLADANSIIKASGRVDGAVEIRSPVRALSETLAPLQASALQATPLLRAACAAKLQGGQASSFVQRGRDTVPSSPGGMLASPLMLAGGAGAGDSVADRGPDGAAVARGHAAAREPSRPLGTLGDLTRLVLSGEATVCR